ncbi:protein kinase [Rossellomorea aquimaris]|uniref:serine/threonine protein kinase n=1 Tax=Rossellomorea aquimaris TaxID=189382 RepID=UPI001CD65A3E|nr:protein kinase [Rossellomorea aquimaris]MCA1054523.1 protein kinase [Rossellomorea aquimaris]
MARVLFRKLVDSFERHWNEGEIVGQYQITGLIGKGSYGTEYIVKQLDTGEEAILKRLRPFKKLFSKHQDHFLHETTVLHQLECPHFPTVIETGMHKRTPYFIMEKMEGKTFEDLIFREGKTFSEAETLEIGLHVLNLMSVIHDKGYVHRDLRIPNILWDGGKLTIIDFGLACMVDSGPFPEPVTHRDYMREKSPRSDLYALGHFLLFLLYSSYEQEDRVEKSWQEELNISEGAQKLIRKLLREDRPFQTANEARDALLNMRRKY